MSSNRRVYEIAKELSLESKDVMQRLKDDGVEVNNHFAAVDDDVYDRLFASAGANAGASTEASAQKAPDNGNPPKQRNGNGGSNAAGSASAGGSAGGGNSGGQNRGGSKKRRRVVIDAGATNKPARSSGKRDQRQQRREPEPEKQEEAGPIQVEPGATVQDVAGAIGVPPARIVQVLMGLGEMKTQTQTMTQEEIELVSEELGIQVEVGATVEPVVDVEVAAAEDDPEDLVEKAPVVTVMGHVDHGKTSLLDKIRRTEVASGEAGGITQHIGAYQVENDGRKVTFIDTPGHEAFTEMRARGAKITDVVVLVVAADDGVMPQTEEAIQHARAAGVPLVVALNKIDVPNANPDMVLGQLSERELAPEAWGGETVTVPVSAKSGEGIEDLIENILIVSELEDLKANPKAMASGYVIESQRDPGRGTVATLLMNRGTLHKGDIVLAGTSYGRVRAMLDFTGKQIKEAGPATPFEITGLQGVPEAGTGFEVVEHERLARDRAQQAEAALRRQELAQGGSRLTLDQLLGQGDLQDLNLVVKADVAGSMEALKDSLLKLSTDEVRVNIVRSGVGAVNDGDVNLALASEGVVIGFNVRPTVSARQVADREGVEIRTYGVIYQALEEIEAAMKGMLGPEIRERDTGMAEVRQLFRVPGAGVIAGSYVTSGEISRNHRVRVVRDGTVIYEGTLSSLKRYKDDTRSVRQGFECGIGVENFNDVKEGDVLEFFEMVEVERQ